MRFLDGIGGRLCLLAAAVFLIGGALGTTLGHGFGMKLMATLFIVSLVISVFGVALAISADEFKTGWVVMVAPWVVLLALVLSFYWSTYGGAQSWVFAIPGVLALLVSVRPSAKPDAGGGDDSAASAH